MNGAAAHLISEGEELIIMAFELTDRPLDPRAILVDERNRFVRYLRDKVWDQIVELANEPLKD